MMRFIKIVFIFMVLTACAPQTGPNVQQMGDDLVREKTKSLMNLGDKMVQAGDLKTAFQFYDRAHQEQPLLNEPVFKKYDVLMQGEEITLADQLLSNAVNLDPLDEEMTIKYAQFLVQYDLKKAPVFLSTAADRFRNARLYNWYGVSLDLNGLHGQAQESYEMGRDLEPRNASLLNNLALSYAVTGQGLLSVEIFNDLVEAYPNKLIYHRNRAIALILNGQTQDAEDALRPVMRQDEINALKQNYEGRLEIETPLTILKRINGMS